VLEIKDLVAGYDDAIVLQGVSINVAAGNVVSLVGANGAGKTTTLRTVSGLIRPLSGEIRFLGESIVGLRPDQIVACGVAHVPEGRQLFSSMTVRENLMLGSFPATARANYAKNIDWVYSIFPRLAERDRQLAGTLSGGEQQMVAIGRGLMMNPRLLVLDEPSLGLAPKLVTFIFEIIDTIQAKGVSIFLVEQNLVQSLRHSTVGYVLEAGRIVMHGGSEELLSAADTRTAYLGLGMLREADQKY
jgi:branched-chain amino acid transport system ATP-binding protein